jgi:hypothetical protein
MALTYRTRRFLRRLWTGLLILVLLAVLAWLVWILWLDRFVVYSRDGAVFDFNRPHASMSGELAVPPEEEHTVTIVYNDNAANIDGVTELAQIHGYYLDTNALREDMAPIRARIDTLPSGTAVMLDLKNINGYFFYFSDVGPTTSTVDLEEVAELIDYLNKKGMYLIARIPAFRDYYFGLNYTSNGLFMESNPIGLWMDEEGCYWLDPTKEGTLNYLTRIVAEIKRMGFDEVVFSDFCFPDTDDILFEGDQEQALADAANTLATICASETFCVSFCSETTAFELPAEERCRLYLVNFTAAQVRSAAENTGLEDPEIRVVFITEHGDTRFNEFSVMRPVSLIRYEEN